MNEIGQAQPMANTGGGMRTGQFGNRVSTGQMGANTMLPSMNNGTPYRNSGLARFGANQGNYTPAAYTPQQFTPRTFTSGTMPASQQSQGGMQQGGRVGVTDPSGHGMGGDSPYSMPTGGTGSLGNGQTIYYGDGSNKGLSPGVARGIGFLGGMATGSPILGGVAGQMLNGAGASQAGNMNTAPYSDARNGTGGYGDPSGHGSTYNPSLGSNVTPGTPSAGPGSQQDSPSYTTPSTTSSPDAYRGNRMTAQNTNSGGK